MDMYLCRWYEEAIKFYQNIWKYYFSYERKFLVKIVKYCNLNNSSKKLILDGIIAENSGKTVQFQFSFWLNQNFSCIWPKFHIPENSYNFLYFALLLIASFRWLAFNYNINQKILSIFYQSWEMYLLMKVQ